MLCFFNGSFSLCQESPLLWDAKLHVVIDLTLCCFWLFLNLVCVLQQFITIWNHIYAICTPLLIGIVCSGLFTPVVMSLPCVCLRVTGTSRWWVLGLCLERGICCSWTETRPKRGRRLTDRSPLSGRYCESASCSAAAVTWCVSHQL